MQIARSLKDQRGDTIVEVLIAIAVISAVLAGAFTVTQRSSQAVRSSQERGEMLHLLQGQVEGVRALALAPGGENSPVYSSAAFCINNSGQHTPAGTACNFGTDNRYRVTVNYDSTSDVFTFNGQWDGPNGNPQSARLLYKLEP